MDIIGRVMTRVERLVTGSGVSCCFCDRPLTVQELEEFYGAADERLRGAVYCRACMETQLVLCRECSGRYTAGGICEECGGTADDAL